MSNQDGHLGFVNGEKLLLSELRAGICSNWSYFSTKIGIPKRLVHLYTKIRGGALQSCRMFSIAFVGFAPGGNCIARRDRVRRKTLFFTQRTNNASFLVRTESVACGRGLPVSINEQRISRLFFHSLHPGAKGRIYPPKEQCLPRPRIWWASAKGVRETCYWIYLAPKLKQRSEAEWGDKCLRHEICEKPRASGCMSDVPLGAFLSGRY